MTKRVFGPGDVCAGYRIERLIGHGGFAEVYEAVGVAAPRARRALKVLTADAAVAPKIRERIAQEGEVLSMIDHVNVVRFFDAGVHGDSHVWLLLEYVEGWNLREAIRKERDTPVIEAATRNEAADVGGPRARAGCPRELEFSARVDADAVEWTLEGSPDYDQKTENRGWAHGALVALGGAWALERCNTASARSVCEQFATMVMTNRCHEAYRLTVAATYQFSTEDAFCEENSSDYESASAVCSSGEWREPFLFLTGSLHRSSTRGPAPDLLFGMTLKRVNGAWMVQSFKFDQ